MAAPLEIASTSASNNLRYLFIGDSFIVRLKRYGYTLQKSYVYAKSGTAARDWYDLVDNPSFVDYQIKLNKINPNKIKGIIYYYGINDIGHSYNITYTKRQLDDLMRLFPDIPIYVCKIFPIAVTYSKTNYKIVNPLVKKYNQQLQEFTGEYENLIWIDTTKGFITSYGNLKREKSQDGLHIAEAYYNKWWKNIQGEIK